MNDFIVDQPLSFSSARTRFRFDLSDLVESDAELHYEQQVLLSRFFVELATDSDLNGNLKEVYDRYKRALFAFKS